MSWYDGFDPEVLGGLIDVGSPYINPEPGRPLNAAPPRTYYVNASKRLADLIDSVYERYPNDTVAVVSHSQGTMVAALAMLYVKRVPDTLFLCNSPYCFSDKGLDGLTMGTQAPTSGSRVRTFFNILDRFKQSQQDIARKTSDKQLKAVGGWLDIKTQTRSDGRTLLDGIEQDGPLADLEIRSDYELGRCVRWSPALPTENPVPGQEDHHNHGRVFVYCSPHDRVMGSTPLESIGWKGVDYHLYDLKRSHYSIEVFEKYQGVLYQRQFMRGHSVGSTPDKGYPQTPRYPQDGRPLWIPPSPKLMGLIDELASIGKNEKIYVNGPRVPNPMPAELMQGFNEDVNKEKADRLEISQTTDFEYYKELLFEKRKWVDERTTTPYGKEQHKRYQTDAEIAQELAHTDVIPTNHSTILTYNNGELAHRILAYDLPIGRADSFANREFWRDLIKKADWLEPGSDPGSEHSDTYTPPDPPPGLDQETRQVYQQDIDQTRKAYGVT